MESIRRNEIFMENEDMIRRTIRRHWPLLCALRLDVDDVYQELAIAALNAIDGFDPRRSDSVRVHIWAKLQYAVLDIKRQSCPCGITGLDGERPIVLSVELAKEHGHPPVAEEQRESAGLSPQLHAALSRLDESERQAVIRYLDGQKPEKKSAFDSALDKIRCYYLATAPTKRCAAGMW